MLMFILSSDHCIRFHVTQLITITINPFSTNVSLLYPLKTSENLSFTDVFRGYRSGTLVENGLRSVSTGKYKVTWSSLAFFLFDTNP